ncbi:MAG: autotransporter assembly complex protein TamA [Gammaproteobacteria bacterium]|nr:autotransporter assembly complex protein TamA [Gammaproteobacteria bacterium]
MYKTRQMLLVLLTCCCPATLFAQVSINVDISGIEPLLEDNVRLFLSIEQQKEHALMSEGRLRRLHKKAPQEIASALQPFGYYRAVINTELVQVSADQWLASYAIDPGPPLPITEFSFAISESMQNDPEFQELIQNLPLHKGDAFNHLKYENIKLSLSNLAYERGYFNTRFIDHRVEIDLNVYEARVHLDYDGSVRYNFGEVLLKQDVLDDDLLRRYIPFKSGEPYTLDALIDLQQSLNDSDYFQTVEVSPGEPLTESFEIPVNVALTPRKRHRYSFGLGYGTDTGARTKFSWEIPRLNAKGHRFDTGIGVSEIGYNLAAHYRVPVLNPRTDQMVYSAGVVKETTDTGESIIRTVGASLKRGKGDWRESISLNYQQEDYIIANVSNDSTLLMPGINWSRTWGNDFINTFDGLRFDIGLRGANTVVISDTSFAQVQGSIKGINSLNENNRIISRGSLGRIWADEFQQLPSSVRFFAGGAQSVRGYAYHSLGPVDQNNLVVGGKNLMVGSIEYEHSFSNKWAIAVFYDGGNAIDSLSDDLEQGAGFGFRWKSPVGPVRVDLASAITQDDRPWRLHINIGPDL